MCEGLPCCFLSAVHVIPARGVGMEVVLAQAWWVVGGGVHVAGGHRGGEVVARLIIHLEIVLVKRLQWVGGRNGR